MSQLLNLLSEQLQMWCSTVSGSVRNQLTDIKYHCYPKPTWISTLCAIRVFQTWCLRVRGKQTVGKGFIARHVWSFIKGNVYVLRFYKLLLLH